MKRVGPIRSTLIAGALGTLGVAPGVALATQTASVVPVPAVAGHLLAHFVGLQPPTTLQCETDFGIACFTVLQLEEHYDLAPLYADGLTGAGKTIVIIDSYGSPTIQKDLQTFDSEMGLPNPSLSIIQPVGAIPPFDPTNSTMVGWAEETTLDVEMSHSMAPGAKILLVETPVAETEGVTGFPQMMAAENYVINHHLGDVISQSFGATEETFPSKASLMDLRYAFKNAEAHNVTVLASAGDTGATNDFLDGSCCYAYPVNSWPSSDPLVTSMGGSELYADSSGNALPLSADTVWNDGYGAGGGGVSEFFSRPSYQNGVASVVGNSRGTPDISMSSAVNGGVDVYISFAPLGPGWYIFGGTSEASPLFAGIVAIADQAAHHDLGLLNPALYRLQGDAGIVDITVGNNSFAGVTGYNAGPGYDLASGLGTVDANALVHELAH
jgi:subtilase family serine protease